MERQKLGSKVVSLHSMNGEALKSVERKLNELIALLETTDLNDQQLAELRRKLDSVLPGPEFDNRVMQKFEKLDDESISRTEKADNLEQLLKGYKTDSKKIKQNKLAKGAASITRIITALLLIMLGFGMIIMPAPQYFEMFTLFYLNPNDGVTIMDVISLIVVFAGISLLISSIIRFNK